MVDDHGVSVRPLSSRPSDLLREAGVGICHEKLAVDLRQRRETIFYGANPRCHPLLRFLLCPMHS
jgi:hypothetical protein